LDPTARSVLSLARGVLSDLDLETVLARVLDSARELTGARYAALGVLDEQRSALARFVTVGIDAETRRAIGPLPTGRGVLGELIAHPVPLRLADVGAHTRSYGFPAGHPPMTTFLGVPVEVAGVAFGNLYLTDKEGGGEFTQDDEDAVALLAGFAGVAIDHARRFTGSERHRGELQRTVDTLDATVQISRALGGQTDLPTILELVTKRGRALVSARALVIELQDGAELVVAAGAGALPDGLIGHRIDLAGTVAGAALRTLQPQRLEDELNRARFQQHGLGHLGLHAAGGLVVPLIFQSRAYGVLVAVDRLEDGPEFSLDDERLLQAFATSAATAVATAQSVEAEGQALRVAAAEEERRRWARELHDETLQGLAAMRLGLASARRTNDSAAVDAAIAGAVAQLESEIASLRGLITELRPAALDDFGVGPAIEALAARAARTGLDVDLAIDLPLDAGGQPGRYLPEVETAIYRIVQEGLTNAGKHGHAARAVVEIVERNGNVDVMLRDDGAGFDPAVRTTGFGLVGMRERAELLGGTLRIESSPEQGTAVSARIPVRRQDAGTPADESATAR
jgi:signal transduction histidine kinase